MDERFGRRQQHQLLPDLAKRIASRIGSDLISYRNKYEQGCCMKLYLLHAAALLISLSFHTNVLDTVILAETVLRHAVVKVDEEDVAQAATRIMAPELKCAFLPMPESSRSQRPLLPPASRPSARESRQVPLRSRAASPRRARFPHSPCPDAS